MSMTSEEFKATEWYQSRPQVIKDLMQKCDPTVLHRIKNSGEIVQMLGYNEDGTLQVLKLGIGGPMDDMIGFIKRGWGVFGLKPEDLEPLSIEESNEAKSQVNWEEVLKHTEE